MTKSLFCRKFLFRKYNYFCTFNARYINMVIYSGGVIFGMLLTLKRSRFLIMWSYGPLYIVWNLKATHAFYKHRRGSCVCLKHWWLDSYGANQGLLARTCHEKGHDLTGKGGHAEKMQCCHGTNLLVPVPGDTTKYSEHAEIMLTQEASRPLRSPEIFGLTSRKF